MSAGDASRKEGKHTWEINPSLPHHQNDLKAWNVGGKLVALVTGANKGIGKEIARGLAGHGYHVLLGARREQAGREAAQELADSGEVSFLSLDVLDSNSVIKAAEAVRERFGRLDVLVSPWLLPEHSAK